MTLSALATAAVLVTFNPVPAIAPPEAANGGPFVIDYGDSLDERPARLVAARDAGFAPTREGLKDRVLGVRRETLHHCIAERLFPEAWLRLYETQEEGLADLEAGRIDAMLADAVEAYAAFLTVERGRDFAFLGDELFDRGCHDVAVNRREAGGGTALRNRLDDALDRLEDEGTLDALKKKYFQNDAPE